MERNRTLPKRKMQPSGKMRGAFAFAALLLLIGCSPNPKPPKTNAQNAYFSVKEFFEGEIERLDKEQATAEVTIAMNGKTETQQTGEHTDWHTQLAPFLASDINKPAWRGKYKADTLQSGGATVINYTAKDASLRTQSISVSIKKGAPSAVSIANAVSNLVYAQKEKLEYTKNSGYTIESEQQMLWMQPHSFDINARFGD